MAAVTFTTPTHRTPHRRLVVSAAPPLRVQRLVAAVLLVAIAGALAVSFALATRRAEAPPSAPGRVADLPAAHVAASVHVVQPGDTLWTIARRAQPTGDVRPLVRLLQERTGGRPLQPGHRVLVP